MAKTVLEELREKHVELMRCRGLMEDLLKTGELPIDSDEYKECQEDLRRSGKMEIWMRDLIELEEKYPGSVKIEEQNEQKTPE